MSFDLRNTTPSRELLLGGGAATGGDSKQGQGEKGRASLFTCDNIKTRKSERKKCRSAVERKFSTNGCLDTKGGGWSVNTVMQAADHGRPGGPGLHANYWRALRESKTDLRKTNSDQRE